MLDDFRNGTISATGAKTSAASAGVEGQVSWTNDYFYICVVTGTAGHATWKRFPILLT